jgi:acyl-CoA synthetase (AMP-forming)/AMP-acid ligase II
MLRWLPHSALRYVLSLIYALQISTDWTRSQFANPNYQVDELVHQISNSGAKLLVVGKSVLEVAKMAAVKCGISERSIYLMEEEDYEHHKSIWSLAGTKELEPRRLSPQEAREQTAFMCYSSGTTGKAKGGTWQSHIFSIEN